MINKLKLSQKLIILVSIPLILMVGFALEKSITSFSLYRTTVQLESMTNLSIYASGLVHELQKERGITAGFLGSKGPKFSKKIIEQRKLSDEKAKALKIFLNDFDAASIGEKFDNDLKDALAQIELIEKKRTLVNEQNIQAKEAISYYTNMNALFLGLISKISVNSPNGELAVMTAAYANYLQSKEHAGIERAVLSSVFARDDFGPFFPKFISLIAAQKNYMSVYLSLAKEADIAFYNETVQGKEVNEVLRLRQVAQENSVTGDFGIDPAYWFKQSTGRIERLKKVENYLSEKLFVKTHEMMSGALIALLFSLFIALFGVIVSILFGWLEMRSIHAQIGGEPDYIEQIASSIADGQLDMALKTQQGASTGVYAAMIKMRQRLSDVIEKDIQTTVNAAREGNLEHRINLQGKTGFYKELSTGINDVVDASDNVIMDTVRVFGALSKGNLKETIDREYHGSFNQLKQDANATVEKIKEIIEVDIQGIINSAHTGDLSCHIEMDGKEGFFMDLSTGINQLIFTLAEVFKDVDDGMTAISSGDLTKNMDGNYSGDFAKIQDSFNSTTLNLLGIVGEIRSAASHVSMAANEISQGNTDLSQRTEEQAASLEETASSMEELTSTVKQNADNSRQANQLAASAAEQAKDGEQILNSTIDAIEKISQSSKKIEDIIGVIDEIAFQTNLLALNAAVEAARAGEQGRGFAVVASEVRNLAQRSASAAKEIKILIKDSVESVDEGVHLASNSGETLSEVVGAVTKVSNLITEIAASSNEQSKGIEQINQVITQLDEVTQQNAALVEEAAAASESMNEQAKGMNDMVDFFNVGEPDSGDNVHQIVSASKPAIKEDVVAPVKAEPAPIPSIASSPSVAKDDSEWEEF